MRHGFRLLEPVRQLAAREARWQAARATRLRRAHTDWYLELMDPSRRSCGEQAGSDRVARWRSETSRTSGPLRAADRSRSGSTTPSGSSSRPTGLSAASSMWRPMYEWAPMRSSARHRPTTDRHRVGVRHRSVGRDLAERLRRPRRQWLRRGVDAIEAGSRDDGFVSAAAIHHVLSGGERGGQRRASSNGASRPRSRATTCIARSGSSPTPVDSQRRSIGREQLGNRTLIALAQQPAGRPVARRTATRLASCSGRRRRSVTAT